MAKFSKGNQPEQRGDPKANGAANGRRTIMTDALMLALKREVDGLDGKPTKRLNMIAERLAEKAAEGDTQAIKEIFDRTEGKAAQAIELSGQGGGPINFNTYYEPKPK